jgi:hypothetical protein
LPQFSGDINPNIIMNIKNLRAIAALCRDIPQDKFDMGLYRSEDHTTPECGSAGCVLGHATRLETGELPRRWDGSIDFEEWSESFTGLQHESHSFEWCFSSDWERYDNSPLGAAKRIEWMLKGNEVPNMFNGPTAEMVAMYS